MTRLAVITINHHHTDLVPKAIASMSDIANACSPHMFLINNIPDQTIKDWLSKEHPEITLIENPEPKGFGSNINSVIRQFPDFDYYLLVNPDVICLPDMVAPLLALMEDDDRVGVAGPMLLNMDGTVQPSRRRFATFWVLVVRALHLDAIFKNLPSVDAYFMNDVQFGAITPVNWLTGAVMLLRKSALDEVGLFDERFHLYFEDEDLCCRMWQAGWKVCYVHTARAYHKHIAEGRKKIFSKANRHHITSAIKMLIKYRGNIADCVKTQH